MRLRVLIAEEESSNVDRINNERTSDGHLRLVTPLEGTPDSEQGFMELKKKWSNAFEKEYILTTLKRFKGNVSAAARYAKLDRSNFLRLLRRHGLKADGFRTHEETQIDTIPKAA